MIRCSYPLLQYQAHRQEIDAAIRRVLDSGWYILGQEVSAFESEFSAWCGATHGVGVANGTDAIELALRACGVGPGDEVITVANTAVATVAAVQRLGAIPVFCDIDPVTMTLNPVLLEAVRTVRTRAVIPVHLYGHPVDMTPLMEFARNHGLRVIEDCAQAHGARYDGRSVGTIGDMGCFSFYPTKNLGAIGDGGMVVTSDCDSAEKLRSLRQYGWDEQKISLSIGCNSRLDELQAAILRAKLPHLDNDTQERVRIANRYSKALDATSLTLPTVRDNCTHVYHQFVIRCHRRDELLAFLRERNVGAAIHYPVPIHLQPAYQQLGQMAQSVAETERAAGEILSLPIYPELSERDQQVVIDTLLEWETQQ